MKLWTKMMLGILVAWGAYWAYAQVNTTGDINLAATAPTQNTDGSVLTDLTSIRVYRKLGSTAYAVHATEPFVDEGGQFAYTDSDLSNGSYCYEVTAINSQGNESPFSNEACKTVLVLFPRAPTNLTAQ